MTKPASLLKKVVDRADVMKDGALSREEIRSLGAAAKGVTKDPATLAALQGAHGFGRATGPQPLADVKKSIDDLKARVRAADKDGDSVLTPKAKPIFDAYAKSLGLSSLTFKNPAAPIMPNP